MEPSNYLLNAAHYLSLSCTNEIIHEHRTTNGNTTDYDTVVLPVIMLCHPPLNDANGYVASEWTDREVVIHRIDSKHMPTAS